MLPRQYLVEILDNTLTPICQLKSFIPLDSQENYLTYTQVLSNKGMCRFRISTKDPLFLPTGLGDILQDFQFHVRIKRYNTVVWQGSIIDNVHRTKDYVEIRAYTYIYLLSKMLVRHDTAPDPNYRTFNSGTLATAVQTVLTEAITDAASSSVIQKIQIGSIVNPTFPAGFQDTSNNNIGGQPWTFGDTLNTTLVFDYRDIFYVISSFANYAACDFSLTPVTTNGNFGLQFNFAPGLGNSQTDVMFEYPGAIEDYDIPLLGSQTANHLVGIAADNNFNVLKQDVYDNVSIGMLGKLDGVAAYNDVKSSNILLSRLNQELSIVSTPQTEVNVTLNDKAYPLGVYGLGDVLRIRIRDHFISYDAPRRAVGINVTVNVTGKETIQLITNPPRPAQ